MITTKLAAAGNGVLTPVAATCDRELTTIVAAASDGRRTPKFGVTRLLATGI